MRWFLFISALILLPSAVLAQTTNPEVEYPQPPADYKALRFEEDYSFLTNRAESTNWAAMVKYIPLRTNEPLWYMTLGGELRERFEGNFDPNYGIPKVGSDSYLLQRISLLTDFHLGERVRFFVQGISGIVEGESLPAPPTQNDPADLLYAFMDVVPYLTDDERLTLRGGRFGMYFGAGRLVATRAAPNIPFRFQGLEAEYTRPDWDFTGFLTQPVQDLGRISGADHTTTFWGLYTTHYFDKAQTTGLDLYYLGIHNLHAVFASGTGDELRHSLGMREFGVWHHWDWDAEQVLQLGSFERTNSILAWTAALDWGYTWDTMWQPRLGTKMGIVSGSDNLHDGRLGTFDALFFKSGYFNDASLIRPSNLIGFHPNATLTFSKKVSLDGGADWFWRYSRNDAIYAVPGFISVPANPNAPSYVETALDVNLNYRVQRHILVQASYVHVLTGAFIHQAGGSDVNYLSTTFSFLF